MSEIHVYELDIDALIAELSEALTQRGFEVVEQVPAGIWWFKIHGEAGVVRSEIGRTFAELAERRLRRVES